MEKLIYLDNAATTKPLDGVIETVERAMREEFYNPSALYDVAVKNSAFLRKARETVKTAIHAGDGEFYFTSGGTESNNLAILRSIKQKSGKVILGGGEHDSVYACANELKERGYEVLFAPIDSHGVIDVDAFKNLLDENVRLVSIMHASNETGGINDVENLVKLTKRVSKSAIFHSDGVQAFGKIPVNVTKLNVDLYSVSAHKIHAPKGIGGLYVKKGVTIKPMLLGGGQEKGMRSGTENFPSIAGFKTAVEEEILHGFNEKYSKILQYREYLYEKLQGSIDDIQIITPMENSVPNILTVAFKDVRGEVLLHSLEKHGILVGIGSACSSHHESRFKSLLGLDDRHKDGIIRFSMSEENDIEEVDYVVDCIRQELNFLTKFTRI